MYRSKTQKIYPLIVTIFNIRARLIDMEITLSAKILTKWNELDLISLVDPLPLISLKKSKSSLCIYSCTL